MTSPIERIREVALTLPETEERGVDGQPTFFVAGTCFAQVDGGMLILSAGDGDGAGRTSMDLAGDMDWSLVEDRIAQSWELAAPQRLLEAGGR